MAKTYLVRYLQKGDAALRETKRPEHIAYRKALGDSLLLAGPLLNEDDVPVGSVVIVTAENLDDAMRIVQGDPFVLEGLLECLTIEPMRVAAMKPPI